MQHAVKEDVLRYHKTLIVWSAAVDKHKREALEDQKLNKENSEKTATLEAKLQLVRAALIEILRENNQGMSLAQLPLYLRKKLPFSLDLNELGFPKLKNLILSMTETIKLELRGHNHPYATLISDSQTLEISAKSNPARP